MEFEWDQRKYKANELKHGVAFEEAVEAFDDPLALRLPDARHSTPQEKREILIGRIVAGVLLVVFTIRLSNKIRIISARRASQKERKLYEERKENSQ